MADLKKDKPLMLNKEIAEAIRNIGKNGYDYRKTHAALIELTQNTLENLKKIEDKI